MANTSAEEKAAFIKETVGMSDADIKTMMKAVSIMSAEEKSALLEKAELEKQAKVEQKKKEKEKVMDMLAAMDAKQPKQKDQAATEAAERKVKSPLHVAQTMKRERQAVQQPRGLRGRTWSTDLHSGQPGGQA